MATFFFSLIGWRGATVLCLALAIEVLAAFFREKFPTWLTKELVEVLLGIVGSVVAGFIFYLAIEVSRRHRETTALAPYVTRQIDLLRGDVEALTRECARIGSVTLSDGLLNEGDIRAALAACMSNQQANLLLLNNQKLATAFDYLADRSDRSLKRLADLVQLGPHLGADLMAQISKVQSSGYMDMVQQLRPLVQQNLTKPFSLEAFSSPLNKHYDALNELRALAMKARLYNPKKKVES